LSRIARFRSGALVIGYKPDECRLHSLSLYVTVDRYEDFWHHCGIQTRS